MKLGVFKTIRADVFTDEKYILETVFENGEIKKEYTFEEIRERIISDGMTLLG